MENVEIWTIGFDSNNSDKIITWYEQDPNLYEPNVIIVNLESLDDVVLKNINKNHFYDLRNKICNKFLMNGTIIFIISDLNRVTIGSAYPTISSNDLVTNPLLLREPPITYYNYELSPVHFLINKMKGKKINIRSNELFASYLSQLQEFDFLLHNFQISPGVLDVTPVNDMTTNIIGYLKKHPSERTKINLQVRELASDNAGNSLSARCWFQIEGYWRSGDLVYLPKPSNMDGSELIDKILQIYGKSKTTEKIPDWAFKTRIPGVSSISKQIETSQSKLLALKADIDNLLDAKQKIENYYYLLSSKDNILENIVFEAFKELGFNEIRKIRAPNKEDWIIEFQTMSEYKYGVIEVKGSDTRTKLSHLRQTDNWVSDYLEDKITTKGIFISNQYRFKEYPEFKSERSRFEDNEIKYASGHDICILPSFVLLESIIKNRENSIGRAQIESAIAKGKGIVNDLTK